jgi:hypothetical protein
MPELSIPRLAILVACLISADGAWADITGKELMERNFFVSKISAFKSQMTMLLKSPDGQNRERKIETSSKLQDNGVDSKLIVRFHYPADIKGAGFLEIEHMDAEDDLWLYLPALQKVRRLVSNNKKDSFMGSDFSYGEMLPPRVELYQHTVLRSEPVDGQDCHVVESVPLSDAEREASGYSKKISWLRKDSALEAKVEYYDLQGQLLKVQLASQPKLVEADKNRWLPLVRQMTNVQTGHATVISFDAIDTEAPIADSLFVARSLDRQ